MSQLTAAVIPEPPPVEMEVVRLEVARGSGAEPRGIVHLRRCLRFRTTPDALATMHDPRLRHPHGPKFPGPHELNGRLKMRATPLLQANLHDTASTTSRLNQHGPFLDRVRRGAFEIHVLACLQRESRHRHMPVIRRRDHHRIKRRIIEQPSKVALCVRKL